MPKASPRRGSNNGVLGHPNARLSLAERFEIKVDRSGDCHRWIAGHNSYGYGAFRVGERAYGAHVVALWLAGVDIPPGMTVDHVWARGCRHRDCVNVAHLEVVPNKVNILRGGNPAARNARKSRCEKGHQLTVSPSKPEWRRCLTCAKASDQARDHSLNTRRRREREAADPSLREARLERRRQQRARAKSAA